MDAPKILVVEDEKDVAKVISINLKLEGMDVLVAYDGPGALSFLDHNTPDCVVLDIMLPKISGWDILKHIKSNPLTSDIPVVMVTARIAERDQLRGLGAGAVKYITKPFSPLALTDVIKSVLKPQAREEVAKERRETIERLQLSTLYKISDILISAQVSSELLEGVADKLIDLFGLSACALILGNEETEVYTFRGPESRNARKSSSVSRSVLPPEMAARLRDALVESRGPLKTGDLEGFNLDTIFPGSGTVEEGYAFPFFEGEKYLGSLIIPGRTGVAISRDEENLLLTTANQIAAAIARARLHDSLREDELVHRRLLHQCITGQEAERRRLAGEIHDSVVQSLVGISFRLQALEKKIPPDAREEIAGDIQLLVTQLNSGIEELRELLIGLRPPMLDDMGLFSTLEAYLKNFQANTGIQTRLLLPEELPSLSKDAQTNLFRIFQEALNNIEKHAKASRATIEFETVLQKLSMTVRDDGKGFSAQGKRARRKHLGIAGMRERAELLGGKLKIDSEAGRGTVITLQIPLKSMLEG